MTRLSKVRTYMALGAGNLARVGLYRMGLKSGLHPVQWLRAVAPEGPFFAAPGSPAPTGAHPRSSWGERTAQYFGRPLELATPIPDWHANPYRKKTRAAADRPWWTIPDFDPSVGDIKTVWEASRFDWVMAFAQRSACSDTDDLVRLNDWLADWLAHAPPYLGANWKCGQEASMRVLHLTLATLLLGQSATAQPGLLDVIRLHLRRIAPTLSYAIGQANNHGTSEAAALFVGGSLLAANGDAGGEAVKWERLGRKWMENRAMTLIALDGSFSQYSTTYHRLMLDTCNLVEIWRQHLKRPEFSARYMQRMALAADWLRQMTDPVTGDAPNIGANDGSRLMVLCDSDYRDFRPTVQMSMALFQNRRAYNGDGLWNQPLIWTGVALPSRSAQPLVSESFDRGGLHVLRQGRAVAYLRYPRFDFRPRQADALHCDLWVGGSNLTRDAGSFCYNHTPETSAYFNGTGAHNTVQFDGRDQMTRLSRFLYGDWLQAEDVVMVHPDGDGVCASAAYHDRKGCYHKRSLILRSDALICRDDISGFEECAVLRWRLYPGDWTLTETGATLGGYRVSVTGGDTPLRITLVEGQESRYYLHRSSVPVLGIEVRRASILETIISFADSSGDRPKPSPTTADT